MRWTDCVIRIWYLLKTIESLVWNVPVRPFLCLALCVFLSSFLFILVFLAVVLVEWISVIWPTYSFYISCINSLLAHFSVFIFSNAIIHYICMQSVEPLSAWISVDFVEPKKKYAKKNYSIFSLAIDYSASASMSLSIRFNY